MLDKQVIPIHLYGILAIEHFDLRCCHVMTRVPYYIDDIIPQVLSCDDKGTILH